eukprot:g6793.t1
MDPVGLVQDALAPLRRAGDAIQAVTDLKIKLRQRYGDYSSILESLESKPDVVTATVIERELRQLTELFTMVEDLIGGYTAAPADGRFAKLNFKTKRAACRDDVNKKLEEIDGELGNMTEDEALELLRKTTMTMGQPGDEVRTHMTKVVARCGRLPLVLAIAGSMPVVKGKGLIAASWDELIRFLETVAKTMRARGDQPSSVNMVLEASFGALAETKQKEVLKMAVLAAGAVAPIEMLLNLWGTKDMEGTREEAEGLVRKSLLQDMGGGRYRVHDLVLEFVKIKIKADADMVGEATASQAQYLARLDVVESYGAGLTESISSRRKLHLGDCTEAFCS